MPEVRMCPQNCGNKLRSNNTRGVCKTCWDEGKRPDGGADEAPPASGSKQRARHQQELKEFRQVAKLLGLDGDAMLVDFARSWLASVRAKAKSLIDPEEA